MRMVLDLNFSDERTWTNEDVAVFLYRLANDIFVNVPDKNAPVIQTWRTPVKHSSGVEGTLDIFPGQAPVSEV